MWLMNDDRWDKIARTCFASNIIPVGNMEITVVVIHEATDSSLILRRVEVPG